jgi:hypothetical protein
MDSAEFTYWMGYFGIEPWGEEWLQTGNVCQMIYAANAGPRSKRTVPDDWVYRPLAPKRRKKQTAEEMREIFDMIGASMASAAPGTNYERICQQTQYPALRQRG